MPKTQAMQVYHTIQDYLEAEGYPPRLEDLTQRCRLSPQQVRRCLRRLESAGWLTFQPTKPRGVRLKSNR